MDDLTVARWWRYGRLDSRWRTLRAVPVGDGGADIDQLVIGPAGVFTLNTKPHPGAKIWVGGEAVMINGRQVPYVRDSRHEAARAARLLTEACRFGVEVTGVIVPVGADDIVIRELPPDVQIVNRRRVANFLTRLPKTLDPATVDLVYAAARRSSTWQRAALPAETAEPRR